MNEKPKISHFCKSCFEDTKKTDVFDFLVEEMGFDKEHVGTDFFAEIIDNYQYFYKTNPEHGKDLNKLEKYNRTVVETKIYLECGKRYMENQVADAVRQSSYMGQHIAPVKVSKDEFMLERTRKDYAKRLFDSAVSVYVDRIAELAGPVQEKKRSSKVQVYANK